MDVLRRNNVKVSGEGSRPIVFAHGFGCDYKAWSAIAPDFEADCRVVLFDHVGAGGSDLSAYDSVKYATFDGYVSDALEVMDALHLQDAIFVGHSAHREDVPKCPTLTLVLQTQADVIAPVEVGHYMHRHLPRSDLVLMQASGHCPHMSAPEETKAAIRGFLER